MKAKYHVFMFAVVANFFVQTAWADNKSIDGLTISDIASYTYTGAAICPAVVVKDDEYTLQQDVDYSVECSDNVSVGTATATITGIGAYEGEVSKTFAINPKSVQKFALEYTEDFEYTGEEICPEVVVKDGEKTLTPEEDYYVECYENVNVYDKSNFAVFGRGNYTGSNYSPFRINPKDVKYFEVVYEPSQPYTGEVVCPEVVVKDGEKILEPDVDYTTECTEDIYLTGYFASVHITGLGNYSGIYSAPFTIVPKETNFAAVQFIEDENGKSVIIDGTYGENDAVEITEDVDVASVEYTRSFPQNTFSTTVLPFDVNTSQISGLKMVLRYFGLGVDEQGKKAIKMKVVWADTSKAHVDLLANTPYMVLMKDASFNVDGGVTLRKTTDAVAEIDGWEFRGTWTYKSWEENDPKIGRAYGFAASASEGLEVGDFVKVAAGAWMRPMRAYLVKKNVMQGIRSNGSYVKRSEMGYDLPEKMSIIIDHGGEGTTVIGRLNTRTGEIKMNRFDRVFDLKGRNVREGRKAKGVYLKK
jgi:hypothetical protein